MSNDDLGQFPTPPLASNGAAPPLSPEPQPSSDLPTPPSEPITIKDNSVPTFEPTPDVIPSIATFDLPTSDTSDVDVDVDADTDVTEPEPIVSEEPDQPSVIAEVSPVIPAAEPEPASQQGGSIEVTPIFEPAPSTEPEVQTTTAPIVTPPLPPEEYPATIIPKGGPSFGPLILIGLLFVAGIGLAASVYLFSQSKQLKNQLSEITQTLQKQQTIITPSPTPTEVIVVTPSLTPTETPLPTLTLTPTATSTPSPTLTITVAPTPTGTLTALPLAAAPTALRVAINHEPNAQMILLKTENATDLNTTLTKYYFRQNLTTKKYFYVSIDSKGQSQVVNNAIYVTPDNNIPSLNDMILGNTLGIDFDQAFKIATDLCSSATTCTSSNVKAQYIKTGDVSMWQLTLVPQDGNGDSLIIQINSQTKEVLYKSAGFK